MCFSTITTASEQTYVREYIYQASEADSKLSARTIALQEVKRELLSELGTHVSSLVTMQSDFDGRKLNREEIETLSAGVTRVELKVGAVILRNTRRIRFLLSSACPYQKLFFHVAARLAPG